MKRIALSALVVAAAHCSPDGAPDTRPHPPAAQPRTAVVDWSNEARRAIVPPGPAGGFGAENYGNKFPGEAAVYMGIVHLAIDDAAQSVAAADPGRAAAAIATAAHHTLVGLQPGLGLSSAQQATLDERYATYLSRIPDGPAKADGVAIGDRAARAVLAARENDGRQSDPRLEDLHPPAPGPGVWEPGGTSALGLRLPGIKPLGLERAAQFRPGGPDPLASAAYADDLAQVRSLGGRDSAVRTAAQTEVARFWTDHDLRQWNDALLRLAADRGLDLAQTARLLAMSHVAGGDAMIACFDAKYAYWFWRPHQAIPRAADTPGAATRGDPSWEPLAPTPVFPEYPSAHACHTTAIAEVVTTFFGSRDVPISIDSRITRTTRHYAGPEEVVREVCEARMLAGFHFFGSNTDGSELGRAVARHVLARRFAPRARRSQR